MMDAVKFISTAKKICSEGDCSGCVIERLCAYSPDGWPDRETIIPIIPIIEEYLKTHPAKTRQSEFLKHYPNAPVYDDLLTVLPCNVDVSIKDTCAEYENCYDCKKAYWSEEIE